ncbi:hypothetical protein [Actinomycetospora atypica]
MEQCRQCGGGPVQGGWCRSCGAPAAVSPVGGPPIAGPPGVTTGPPQHAARPAPTALAVRGRAQAMPVLLWAAIGALALAAVLCLVTVLESLTTSGALSTAELQVLASTAGQAAPALGLVGTVWFSLAAWFVALGSRPARAFVLVGAAIGTAALLNGLLVGTLASAALLVLAAAVVLVVVPDARAWFAGPYARPVRGPVSLLVARTAVITAAILAAMGTLVTGVLGLIAVVGGLAAAAGAARSELGSALGGLLGVIGGFALVLALLLGGLTGLLVWATAALGRRSRPARVVVTVLAGLVALGSLLALDATTLPGLVLAAVVVGALWVPDDARHHFGDAPLPAVARGLDRLHATVSAPREAPASSSGWHAASQWPPPAPPETGQAWQAPRREPDERAWSREAAPDAVCALCGTAAPPGSTFCGNCGSRV